MKTLLYAAIASSILTTFSLAQTRGDYQLYGSGCRGTGTTPGGPVIPNQYTSTWGESNNIFPWGTTNQRYMQVHGSAEVSIAPVTIRGLAWRQKQNYSITARVIPCVVNIGYCGSTTLSTSFASNWSVTPTTGYSGSLNVPASATANASVTNFSTKVPFTTPFIYIPTRGNLLWECQNSSSSRPGLSVYDRVGNTARQIGRMWGTGPTAATGTFRAGEGLVTQLLGPGTSGAVVNLTNTGVPVINNSMTVHLSGARANAASLLWLGAQQLNISLGTVAPGCSLYTSLDVLLFGTASDASGDASFTVSLPNNPNFVGVQYYNQWAVLDAPANTIGVVLSNGGAAKVGG